MGDHQAEWQRFKGLQLAFLLAVSVLASPHNQATSKLYFCYLVQDRGPCTVWSNSTETKFGAEKVLLKGHTKRINEPPNPNSPKDLSKAFLKAKWGKGEVDGGQLLDAETLCPHWPDYNATVNLQLNECSSLFTFYSSCEWKSIILFKVKALRIGYPVYFKL